MAKQVKFRRGTTTETNAFTGALAEVTVDTTKDTLVVHDGAQAGGFPVAAISQPAGHTNLINRAGTVLLVLESDGDLTANSATAMDVNTSGSVPMTRSIQGAEAERITTARSILKYQPAPDTTATSTTLTAANINKGIYTFTGGTAQTITFPTGTTLEGISTSPTMTVDSAIDFCLINTGSNATIAANTGLTFVGSTSFQSGASALFRIRKTATNTFVAYRIGTT